MCLSEHDIEQLEDILFSENFKDDTLDYFGLHGLVISSIVGPIAFSPETYINLVFAEDAVKLSEQDKTHFLHCCSSIAESFQATLLKEEEIELPYNDEPDNFEDCLESWCIGFMEGFFHNEKAWFNKGEDSAAELLIPIMTLSGLFDSDEFQEILKNDKLVTQFESVLPELLADIYLFYKG